jgi:enoyl-CoA hydratase
MITSERAENSTTTVLRIDHGPVNALDLDLCRELTRSLQQLSHAGPVVLTGAGKAFSAGVDLRRMLAGGTDYVLEFFPALDELFQVAFSLPVPLVAAVQGHAIAGGAVLAAAADTVLMADGPARIGVPELNVGVPFPHSALEILRHRSGEATARRLVLQATTHRPLDAAGLGLVDEVVEATTLDERSREVAARQAALIPPDTFALTKAQLRADATARIAARDNTVATEIWCRRVTDGWIERYLDQVTGAKGKQSTT